jgi:hypothetical protein
VFRRLVFLWLKVAQAWKATLLKCEDAMGISAVSSPGDLAVALPPGFDVPLGTYHMGDPAFRFP